jgi:predicted amidophosphoribosyltransferase
VRRVIVAHKDDGRVALLPELARLWRVALAGALAADAGLRGAAAARTLVVVPVPSTAASVRTRGRDPWGDIVAAALADEPRVPLLPVLSVRRRVRDQAGLGAAERAANLAGAMLPRRGSDLTGLTCVVADDVITTGATLTEATRALRAAGTADVRAVVVAATARRSGSGSGLRPSDERDTAGR